MTDKTVKVWDPLVRIFHWSLVVFFFTAYASAEEAEGLHVFAGYVVLALVLFRIIWGFVGTKHARFTDFVYGPAAIARYLKGLFTGRPAHYLGHNPAGGVMVIALLVFLLLTCWSGLETYGAEGHGPLAGGGASIASVAHADGDDDDDERYEHRPAAEGDEEFWEEVHEFFAGFTLFLVIVHILGAIVSSVLHRENLIMAMVTGRKSPPPAGP